VTYVTHSTFISPLGEGKKEGQRKEKEKERETNNFFAISCFKVVKLHEISALILF
jgi:hypothetical protein